MSTYQAAKPLVWSPDGRSDEAKTYTGVREDYAANAIQVPDSPKSYPISIKNLSFDEPMFLSVVCDTGTKLDCRAWAIAEALVRWVPAIQVVPASAVSRIGHVPARYDGAAVRLI